MNFLKNLWNWFNGKKTIIGLTLLAIISVDTQVAGIWHFTPAWLTQINDTLAYIGDILAGGGLLHKGYKASSPTN